MQTVLPFTALCYSSRYFPTAANEPEISHIRRKRLTSALKNKVDNASVIKKKIDVVSTPLGVSIGPEWLVRIVTKKQ